MSASERSMWRYAGGPIAVGPPKDGPADPDLPIIDATQIEADADLTTQVVVVGSGAGGAVVAAALAAKGLDVVIVEQGGRFVRADFHDSPLAAFFEMYESAGLTVTLGQPGVALPYGKAVGGTTVMNSGTCFRLPERVHEQWARAGLRALSSAELAGYYDQLEQRLHVQTVDPAVAGGNADIVHRGVQALGLSGGYVQRNAVGCVGSARCAFGCPSGAKQSMERTYLPDAVAAGARIYARCRVERILVQRGRAAGVQARTATIAGRTGRARTVVIRAEHVVVAAGAIGTPVLLRANRLGGPAVGRHLHIHPATKVVALMDESVGGRGVPQAYYVDELHEEGLMLEGATVPPEFAALALPFVGPRHAELMAECDRLATFGMMVTDTSEGTVGVGPGGRPVVRYRLNRADAATYMKGILLCARLFFAAGAQAVFPGLPGVERLDDEADIDRLAARQIEPTDLELVSFHPMGSCRAGVDPASSVVDPDLSAHDLEGLTVADGSALPSSIGVNPQLTIMALAMRAADHIAERFHA